MTGQNKKTPLKTEKSPKKSMLILKNKKIQTVKRPAKCQ